MRPASSAALTLWSLTQVRHLSTPPPAAPRAALSIAGSLSSRGARMVLPDMTILPGWGVARLPERPGQDRSYHRLAPGRKVFFYPRECQELAENFSWIGRPVACPVVVSRDPTLRSTFTSPAREDTDPTEQTGGLDDRHHASDRPRRAGPSRCADDPRAFSSGAGGWLGADRGQGVRAEPVRVAYPPGPRIGCDVPARSGHRGCRRRRPVPWRGFPIGHQVATMMAAWGARSKGLRRVHLRPG